MKYMMRMICVLVSFNYYLIVTARIDNPYSVLNVPKSASVQEIKKAFKTLAKEWHPDKNRAPEAEQKFVEISEAYKLLSDPERRHLFDTTGQTEDQSGSNRHPFGSGNSRHFDIFDDIFGGFAGEKGGGFRFSFKEDSLNSYIKKAINKRSYDTTVIPESRKQPFVILFFSDWCVACVHIEPIWRRLVEELEPIHFGMNTVHAGKEVELVKKLGVKSVPYLILLLDGHPYHYTQPSVSMASSIDFIKSKFPNKMVMKVDSSNINEFLGGWMDNKVRVLLFGRLDIIRLRYLSIAWEFRDRAVVGYVQMGKGDADSICDRYGISNKVDTLLVFHEDPHVPLASVAMTDLPYATMKDIIESHKYLLLPRLSSQAVFDDLCPIEPVHSRRRLCVVLITANSPEHNPPRQALRDYSLNDQFRERDRVRYTYIFREKQRSFLNSLTAGVGPPEASDLHIVIIWRRDSNRLRYEWVEEKWNEEGDGRNKSREALKRSVRKLLFTNEPMRFEAEIQDLFDEHSQGLVWRIINRLSTLQEYLRDQITSDDLVPAVSILASILFILIAGYVMSYLVKLEEERLRESGGLPDKDKKDGKPVTPQLKVHELRGETYYGLVRLLKPGCRTVVLLCDGESKNKLMPKFYKAAWPYRKNKTLMFAFLNIERTSAMEWYKRILILGLSKPRDLNINPKNTIGTVISLNGHRKYYCIFHAKHPEDSRLRDNSSIGSVALSDSDLDSDSDPETGDKKKDIIRVTEKPLLNYYSHVLFEEQLLDGLCNWMDRLFEGTTHRYYINYWPDWPGK